MKNLLILCLFSISFAFSQNSEFIGYANFQAGVGHSFRTLTPTNGLPNYFYTFKDESERPATGWNCGVNLGIRLLHNLWIEGGVYYSSIRYNVTITYRSESYSHVDAYNQISLPVNLRFYMGKKEERAYLFAGAEANYFLGSARGFHFSGLGGVGIEKKLKEPIIFGYPPSWQDKPHSIC